MGNRFKSVELLRLLTPFTQMGVLEPERAQKIVKSYVSGDNSPLESFICSPEIPLGLIGITEKIKMFIQ